MYGKYYIIIYIKLIKNFNIFNKIYIIMVCFDNFHQTNYRFIYNSFHLPNIPKWTVNTYSLKTTEYAESRASIENSWTFFFLRRLFSKSNIFHHQQIPRTYDGPKLLLQIFRNSTYPRTKTQATVHRKDRF